jgi:PAS domain S-box-containing protein
MTVAVDITERRRAEETLGKSEKQYRLLFDEMLSGFAVHEIICDQSGTPTDYRFLSVNKAFEKMTGLDAAKILGKAVLDILHGTESSWIERYGKVALTGESIQFENYAAPLGKYYEVRAYCPQHGTFATIINDITERKLAEEEIKTKVAELEQFNRLSVGREMRMIELKQKINELSAQLNLPQPYAMDYLKPTNDIPDIGKKDI